jgi:hypothetical protein
MIEVGIDGDMGNAAQILAVVENPARVASAPVTKRVFVLPDTGPNQAPVLP